MRKRPLCTLCLVFLVCKALLFLGFGEQSEVGFRPSPLEEAVRPDESVTVTGRIYKREQKDTYQILYLKNNSIAHSGQNINEPHILIYDQTFLPCKIGNRVEASGTVQFFEPPRNPGNFDQKFYYQKQGISGAVWSKQVNRLDGKTNWTAQRLYQIRIGWERLLRSAIGKRDGAVLGAILLGEKGALDADLKELYQKNGIGHILAISGLHISFLGLGLYKLLRKCGLSYGAAGSIGLLFLSGYVMMIGMGVSSVRAFLMFVLRVGADVTGRAYDLGTAAAVAAAGIVLWQPLYLYDASFLLSFGAVCGIALICPAVEALFPRWPKWLNGLQVSIGINLVMFPLLLYYFFEFPLYSFLLNLIVIPLMSLLLGGAIGGSLLTCLVLPAGVWVLKGCKVILALYEGLCEFGSALPFGRLVIGKPAWWQLLVYYTGLALLAGLGYRTKRKIKEKKEIGKWPVVSACILIAGMTVCCGLGHEKRGELKVMMVDVGQGDGIFLQGPGGGTYLFDTGSSDSKQVGKYRMEPCLKSMGVGTLNYVFVSHGDADHINGVEEMLKRQQFGIKVETLVLPVQALWDEKLTALSKTAEKHGTDVAVMEPGSHIAEAEMEINCLQPDTGFPGEIGNASSMVLSISFREFDLLLTGDVEGFGEEFLIKQKKLKPYDVLKVAHHGSKNSTSNEFLALVQPRYALISAGQQNRYGHPHEETVERLERAGAKLYTTPEMGAIEICTDGKSLTIQGFLEVTVQP